MSKRCIITIILCWTVILMNAQTTVIERPSVGYVSDDRTYIESIEVNEQQAELVANIVFKNTGYSSTGIWMDYQKLELQQEGIAMRCKNIKGISNQRIVIGSGMQKKISLFFDISLLKEGVPFDIVEKESNGWVFRGITLLPSCRTGIITLLSELR